jgi:nicotinamidase-related amidase
VSTSALIVVDMINGSDFPDAEMVVPGSVTPARG